ncbi:MAG: aerobic-type carbon monoxide dehydrogenase, middle subunit CoxM/CutM-like protein [Deltaproteobacteria bacterium]|jgi:carbon-monoxide dehydrogenase medium subunit|nr:aerobic-type carbon monoxide dehydrogenase, middle subunit CoxM/CutM-like protein [Deltaproteobacteria bacterium]
MVHYEYHKPQTIKEAIDLMASYGEEAAYVAGGTDVMVLIGQKKLAPRALISLRNVKDLKRKDGAVIGAGVTHRELQKDAFIQEHCSALHDAVCNLGSTQIRNVATIGGNICTAAPSADTACPLLVLDARAVLMGRMGEREIPIDDFFVGPGKTVLAKGEILKEFRIPQFGVNTGSTYIKHTRRAAMDLPIIGVAAMITLDRNDVKCRDVLCTTEPISRLMGYFEDEKLKCEDVRIAMGVVAPRPIRAKKAEAALKGKVLSEKLIAEVAEIAESEASPRDSVRGEAWYRREMIKVLVRRAIMKAIERVLRPGEVVYPERLW